ncbi:MAG TPA: hypothetical protein VGM81_03570 [Burkholderiaceae bacterium]
MSISPVDSVTATSAVASSTSNPVVASKTAGNYASSAASLAVDAGVIASLSGSTPGSGNSGNSAIDLYNSVANAGPSTTTSSDPLTSSDPTGTAPSNLDSGWASLIKSNPSLSPLAAQLSSQQAIVDTLV